MYKIQVLWDCLLFLQVDGIKGTLPTTSNITNCMPACVGRVNIRILCMSYTAAACCFRGPGGAAGSHGERIRNDVIKSNHL